MTYNAYVPDPVIRSILNKPVDTEAVVLLFILVSLGIAVWYYLLFSRVCSEHRSL